MIYIFLSPAGLSTSCPNPTIIYCATSCVFSTTYLGDQHTTSCRPPTWECVLDRPCCGPTRRPCVRPKTCAPCPHWSKYSSLTVSCCVGHTCRTSWATHEIPAPKNPTVSVHANNYQLLITTGTSGGVYLTHFLFKMFK